MNLRRLIGPCFAVVVYNETRLKTLNVHPIYKPPSFWRILFCYGGYPRQFSCLKSFRALVVPSGGCRKGVILQGRQLKGRFSYGMPVMPDNKRGCGVSVCPCTQTEEYYVCTYGHTVYLQDQTNQTPSPSNPLLPTMPPGTRFTAPLHPYKVNYKCALEKGFWKIYQIYEVRFMLCDTIYMGKKIVKKIMSKIFMFRVFSRWNKNKTPVRPTSSVVLKLLSNPLSRVCAWYSK